MRPVAGEFKNSRGNRCNSDDHGQEVTIDESTPDRFEEIVASPVGSEEEGERLGHSRDGVPIRGFRFGRGPVAVSLLAGCHADEPVGPRLLRHLVGYLRTLAPDDPWLTEYAWWIVPHINPDGERRNSTWADDDADAYDFGRYLLGSVRELPGDDIEFGFPRGDADHKARPENRAVFDWWQTSEQPFALHASLHGTGFAAGPWFLIEPAWQDRYRALRDRCLGQVERMGYIAHDVERHGEKGFFRLERGFCTRPDSRLMTEHFEGLGDLDTAARFRPSSMETIRSFGGDPLTLVSEMPLFVTPGVGEDIGPPDPVGLRWKDQIGKWTAKVLETGDTTAITKLGATEGIIAMPVLDQMKLQWTSVRAGQALIKGTWP